MLFSHLSDSKLQNPLPPRTALYTLVLLNLLKELLTLLFHLLDLRIALSLLLLVPLYRPLVLAFTSDVLSYGPKPNPCADVDNVLQTLTHILGRSPLLRIASGFLLFFLHVQKTNFLGLSCELVLTPIVSYAHHCVGGFGGKVALLSCL
jgi:hypothetical protein